MNKLLVIMLIWGAWILLPVVVDFIGSAFRLIAVLLYGRDFRKHKIENVEFPKVSVIIPAYNEENLIDRCINSLKIQDYPHEKLEVIIVDDGSTDNTVQVVNNHINGNGNGNKLRINGKYFSVGDFGGVLKLYTNGHRGKAYALNTGIRNSSGKLVMNIDSDVILAPDAIRNMVCAFQENEEMGAATGNIEISLEVEERDKNGEIKTKSLNFFESLLAKCQFLEYLNAFRLGRQYQSLLNTEYTLSGAFSAFKREVLFKSSLYRSNTVSEDFDLSLDIHRQKVYVGYVADAKAYIEPVIDLDTLYAQRVRWRRGQLEVCGMHEDMIGNKKFGYLGKFGLPDMLLTDHTMAYPRMMWSVLILFFPFFGYHPNVIAIFLTLMYSMYVLLDYLQTIGAYFIVDRETKMGIEKSFPYCFILPFYRLMIFYFRMSGYHYSLKEPPKWRIEGPVNGIRNGIKGLNGGKFIGMLSSVFLLVKRN
ncbi:MAG: glycosyltransferase [Candidatus Methanofastidiosia archaeon]